MEWNKKRTQKCRPKEIADMVSVQYTTNLIDKIATVILLNTLYNTLHYTEILEGKMWSLRSSFSSKQTHDIFHWMEFAISYAKNSGNVLNSNHKVMAETYQAWVPLSSCQMMIMFFSSTDFCSMIWRCVQSSKVLRQLECFSMH